MRFLIPLAAFGGKKAVRIPARAAFCVALLWCAFAAAASAASANTTFVSPTGDDAGPGTKQKPYKTLAGACAKTSAGKNTIRLAPGRYEETGQCVLPPGVSLVGAGQDKTILHFSVVVDMEKASGRTEPDAFAIRAENGENATVSGLTIDGKLDTPDPTRDRAYGGIFANNVKNFHIHDVSACSFAFGAVYLSNAAHSSVFNCRIDDSGHPHKNGCTGGIVVGDLVDSSIHDNVIREHRGAYGIKGSRLSWNFPPGQLPPYARKGENRLHLVRAMFYNNDVRVRQVGGWGQGQPNMAMELWFSKPEACEIYGNTFNECTSLTGDFSAPKTYRFHHNRLILERGYSYALEADTQDMEIDHNYFANGYYPIACFGALKTGLNIHHNVFDDIEKIQLLYFNRGVKNFRFENNTVYLKTAFPVLVLNSRVSENIRIANNLFYKEGALFEAPLVKFGISAKKPADSATITPGTLHIESNAFVNWKPQGDNAWTGEVSFLQKGERAGEAYFKLIPDSPLLKRSIGATAP